MGVITILEVIPVLIMIVIFFFVVIFFVAPKVFPNFADSEVSCHHRNVRYAVRRKTRIN